MFPLFAGSCILQGSVGSWIDWWSAAEGLAQARPPCCTLTTETLSNVQLDGSDWYRRKYRVDLIVIYLFSTGLRVLQPPRGWRPVLARVRDSSLSSIFSTSVEFQPKRAIGSQSPGSKSHLS